MSAVLPPQPDEQAPLIDQLGGVSGLVASTLPILVFVPASKFLGLGGAIAVALGTALLIALWRLSRKENLQPAFSGVLGVAICVIIAWRTNSVNGFFLYGIWMSLLLCIGFAVSVLLRWPLVGVMWEGINGHGGTWRTVPALRRAYMLATSVWALLFGLRFLIQNGLYEQANTDGLWLTRLIMGWPLTAIAVLVTIFLVKQAKGKTQS